MTAIPDLADHLAAGRRAAMNALVESPQTTDTNGPTPEIYNGTGDIIVNGMNIGAGVDAAVMETLVRLEPELRNSRMWQIVLNRKPTRWARFWKGYSESMVSGAATGLILVAFFFLWAWIR